MKTLSIEVNDMKCEGCENRLTAALKRVDGVSEVSADHVAGTVSGALRASTHR